MNVDEPGQDHAFLAVDFSVRRPGVIPSDKRDPIAGKGDIGIPAISVMPGSLVPRNDPIGVADYGCSQGTVLPAKRIRRRSARFSCGEFPARPAP
jgi:hypothetical protein